MAGKKNKMSDAELAKLRAERIEATQTQLKQQIMKLEKLKTQHFMMVMQARQEGLESQEEQARGLLRRTLATLKQAKGMLMTIDIAMQSRDLAMMGSQFLECIGAISDDIFAATGKTNVKKAEDKYVKAMYRSNQNTQQIDHMLEIGQYTAAANIGVNQSDEFDGEIDNMIQLAENASSRTQNRSKL